MSTIKVDNIRIASESVSRPATGVAAAWVHGTTTAIVLKSLNVSSGTGHGTGDYSYALTAAMDSANYSQPSIVIGGTPNRIARMNSLRSTASVMAIATSNAETNTETNQAHTATIHGELA